MRLAVVVLALAACVPDEVQPDETQVVCGLVDAWWTSNHDKYVEPESPFANEPPESVGLVDCGNLLTVDGAGEVWAHGFVVFSLAPNPRTERWVATLRCDVATYDQGPRIEWCDVDDVTLD